MRGLRRSEPDTSAALGFVEMFEGVFLVWLLTAVYFIKSSGLAARFLSFSPLVAMGRFSYGLYIYHIFVIILYDHIVASLGGSDLPHFARIALLMTASILVASASNRWLEQPIMSWWKDRHLMSSTL